MTPSEKLVWDVARAISVPEHHTTWGILTDAQKDLYYMQAEYAISAMRASIPTPEASDGECPTCQGRGEVWVYPNGLARAPDPAQCGDCHGTGRASPNPSSSEQDALREALIKCRYFFQHATAQNTRAILAEIDRALTASPKGQDHE
jgi:hypothetical protein